MGNEPVVVIGANVSLAWAKVLLHVVDTPGTEITPLLVSIDGNSGPEPIEVPEIRRELDRTLEGKDENSVNTVANTIFPRAIWRMSRGDRQRLYKLYREALPRIAALDRYNKNGTYFSRLIAYDVDALTGQRMVHPQNTSLPDEGNQLEYVIRTVREGVIKRDSALQLSIFDPARDHEPSLYQVFPCLQHLTFRKSDSKGQATGLTLNAFYATQQLLRKAYGNFLGLMRLGLFTANEMGLTFQKLNVFVGAEKFVGGKTSEDLKPLLATARNAVGTEREVRK